MAPEFMTWISVPESQQQAILDDVKCTQSSHVTSFLCLLMYQAARIAMYSDYLPLIFFCDTQRRNSSKKVAGMMIKSLIAQLLSDDLKINLEFNINELEPYVAQKVDEDDVMALCMLVLSLFFYVSCQRR